VKAQRFDVLPLDEEHLARDPGDAQVCAKGLGFLVPALVHLELVGGQDRRRVVGAGRDLVPATEHPHEAGRDLEELRDPGLAHTGEERPVLEIRRGPREGEQARLAKPGVDGQRVQHAATERDRDAREQRQKLGGEEVGEELRRVLRGLVVARDRVVLAEPHGGDRQVEAAVQQGVQAQSRSGTPLREDSGHHLVDVQVRHVDDELGADLGVDVLAGALAIVVRARLDLQPVDGAVLPEHVARDPRLEVLFHGRARGRRWRPPASLACHPFEPRVALLAGAGLGHLGQRAETDPATLAVDADA
jgi:hypothetical protein